MLPVSLDCQFFFIAPSVFSNVSLSCVLTCVPYVASFSGLSILLLPLRYSLTFICPVSCVPYVASFSGLSIFFIAPSVFSNVSLFCVLTCVPYVASFSGLSILLLPLRYSLTFICPVSCVPYVASFSNVYLLYIIHRFRTNDRLNIKQLKLLTSINNLTFTGADTGLVEVGFGGFCKKRI